MVGYNLWMKIMGCSWVDYIFNTLCAILFRRKINCNWILCHYSQKKGCKKEIDEIHSQLKKTKIAQVTLSISCVCWWCGVVLTHNMLNWFKYYKIYIHILCYIVDFVQQKNTKLTIELMLWQLREQAWYWPNKLENSVSDIRRINVEILYWNSYYEGKTALWLFYPNRGNSYKT